MGRNLIGLAAGLISAMFVIFLVEKMGHAIYPPPEGLDMSDPEIWKEHIATVPTGALVIVLLAYVIGSTAGGFIIGVIGGKYSKIFSLVLGAILLILGLINLIILPGHPVWFWILSLGLYIPFCYYGLVLSRKIPERNSGEIPN